MTQPSLFHRPNIIYLFWCIFYTPLLCASDLNDSTNQYTEKNPPAVVLNGRTRQLNINPHVRLFDAKGMGQWLLPRARQLLNSQAPSDFGSSHNIGVSFNNPYWGALAITNNSNNSKWYLQIKSVVIDHLQWFVVIDDNITQRKTSGRRHPEALNRKKYRMEVFALDIPPHKTAQIYFTVSSSDGLSLPFFLYSPDEFIVAENNYFLVSGTYYGIFIFAALIGLSLFWVLKDINYLYYAGNWLFISLLTFLYLDGFLALIIPFTHIWWHREFFTFVLSLGMIFFSAFSKNIIWKDIESNTLLKFSLKIALFLPFVGLFSSIFIPHQYSVMIVGGAIFFSASILFQSSALSALSGGKESLYYCLACSPATLGGLIFGLQYFAVIPSTFWSVHSWHSGAALEAIFLSCVIARKIMIERKEKELAQQQAYNIEKDAQEKLLQTEIQLKNDLEIKVKERTRDLSEVIEGLKKNNIELTELSINDSLTKVYNRTFFNDAYHELWCYTAKQRRACSLIMIDADHFKQVNDQYGHLMGDECLRVIGQILNAHTKEQKMYACRFGGEEFVLLIAFKSLQDVIEIAESIRYTIEHTDIVFNGITINITVSLGVAYTHPHEGEFTRNTLLDSCDQALYRAKKRGRNCVMSNIVNLYPARQGIRKKIAV